MHYISFTIEEIFYLIIMKHFVIFIIFKLVFLKILVYENIFIWLFSQLECFVNGIIYSIAHTNKWIWIELVYINTH